MLLQMGAAAQQPYKYTHHPTLPNFLVIFFSVLTSPAVLPRLHRLQRGGDASTLLEGREKRQREGADNWGWLHFKHGEITADHWPSLAPGTQSSDQDRETDGKGLRGYWWRGGVGVGGAAVKSDYCLTLFSKVQILGFCTSLLYLNTLLLYWIFRYLRFLLHRIVTFTLLQPYLTLCVCLKNFLAASSKEGTMVFSATVLKETWALRPSVDVFAVCC